MVLRLFVVFFVALIVACSGSDDPAGDDDDGGSLEDGGTLGDGGETPGCSDAEAWQLDASIFFAHRAVILDLGGTFTVDEMTATMGDASIELVDVDSRTVGFLVPVLDGEEATLRVEGCGDTREWTLPYVGPSDIDDPQAVVDDVLATLEARVAAYAASEGADPDAAADMESLLDQARTRIAEDDVDLAASVLAANMDLLTGVAPRSICPPGCERRAECLRGRIVIGLFQGLALLPLLVFAPPGTGWAAALAIVHAVYELKRDVEAEARECTQATGDFFIDGEQRASVDSLYAGDTIEVGLELEYTSLSGTEEIADDGTRFSVIEALRESVRRFGELWDRTRALLSPFSVELRGAAYSLSEAATRSLHAVDLSHVTVELVDAVGLALTVEEREQGRVALAFELTSDSYGEGTLEFTNDNPGVARNVTRVAVSVGSEEGDCGQQRMRCCAPDETCSGGPCDESGCSSGRCGPDDRCAEGFAGDLCDEDAGCLGLRPCGAGGYCYGDGFAACEGDHHCDELEACADGVCVYRGIPCTFGAECAGDGEPPICGPFGRCQSGSAGDPCTGDVHCLDDHFCADGTCRFDSPYNERCDSDSDCGGLVCGPSDTCQTPGGACAEEADCFAGQDCRGGSCALPSSGCAVSCSDGFTCHPFTGDCARVCATSADCGGGTCGSGGVCGGPLGAPCAINTQCDSGFCNGTCFPAQPYGYPCVSAGDCNGLSCGPQGCQDGEIGDPCENSDDCRLGMDDAGRDIYCGPTGRCQVGYAGEPCDFDFQCPATFDLETGRATTLHCVAGTCTFGHVGDVCTADSQCTANPWGSPASACGPLERCQVGDNGDLCGDDSDCAVDHACNPRGFCQDGTEGDPCEAASDCPSTHICGVEGFCAWGFTGDRCERDDQCLDNAEFEQSCEWGRCAREE